MIPRISTYILRARAKSVPRSIPTYIWRFYACNRSTSFCVQRKFLGSFTRYHPFLVGNAVVDAFLVVDAVVDAFLVVDAVVDAFLVVDALVDAFLVVKAVGWACIPLFLAAPKSSAPRARALEAGRPPPFRARPRGGAARRGPRVRQVRALCEQRTIRTAGLANQKRFRRRSRAPWRGCWRT
jgi:hypothetical protein